MSSLPVSILHVGLALLLAPLLPGLVNRTKAWFAGRRGPPLVQVYVDLAKLLRKGAVYSRTTSWVFRAGPVVSLAAVLVALAVVPLGPVAGLVSFEGDLLLFAYALGLMRFFTVLAALDTGSPFEGMGASREVAFSALAEPALLLGLAALARHTLGTALPVSLTAIYQGLRLSVFLEPGGMILLLVLAAFAVVFLTENARIPVDDPNTHLELTMIHEAMILDHSGPDLALLEYAAALKLWVLGALVVGLALPVRQPLLLAVPVALLGMGLVAVAVGVVESVMARLRMVRVPHLLAGATVLSLLALVLSAFVRSRGGVP